MLRRALAARHVYPRQFWLILIGMFISTIGTSMIFPFLTIYVSEKLALPLTEAAGLISINGVVGLVAAFIAGPVIDRFGRKWIMVFSLAGNGFTYFLFSQAETYLAFVALMALRGIFQPLYRVGTDAMVSDLVPAEGRAEAYALLRTADNLGVAIGPAVGGVIVATSYGAGFVGAATALLFFALLIAFFAQETMPRLQPQPQLRPQPQLGAQPQPALASRGYGQILRDRVFLAFLGSFTLFKICSIMLWALSGVYAKQNYGLLESQFGLIPTTNALMVVLFQVSVTRLTKRYLPLPVLAIGTFIYALGVGSMALGQGFWGFWLSFVVVTIGELMIMPTASTYVANVAPVEMRGRYMSSFSLTQGVARSIAPLFGGLLNDNISPRAIWYGGGLTGLLSAASFAVMAVRYSPARQQERPADQEPVLP